MSENIHLDPGQGREVSSKLDVGSVSESVTVESMRSRSRRTRPKATVVDAPVLRLLERRRLGFSNPNISIENDKRPYLQTRVADEQLTYRTNSINNCLFRTDKDGDLFQAPKCLK